MTEQILKIHFLKINLSSYEILPQKEKLVGGMHLFHILSFFSLGEVTLCCSPCEHFGSNIIEDASVIALRMWCI
jgi:hypothetical protein